MLIDISRALADSESERPLPKSCVSFRYARHYSSSPFAMYRHGRDGEHYFWWDMPIMRVIKASLSIIMPERCFDALFADAGLRSFPPMIFDDI